MTMRQHNPPHVGGLIYENDFNMINKDTDLGHTFSLGESGDGMRMPKLWDEMKKQNSKVNFSNEIGELLVFISKVATAIRMNTPYNSKYKNLTNRDVDVLNFSELLSEFNCLGISLASGDIDEVRKSCDMLLSFRLSKNSLNPDIKSLMETFKRWGEGSKFNIVSQDEGIVILKRIRDKAHAPDSR